MEKFEDFLKEKKKQWKMKPFKSKSKGKSSHIGKDKGESDFESEKKANAYVPKDKK